MTTVYHFDASTGEHTTQTVGRESPLEPGVILVPRNATIETPPELQPGEAAVWDGAGWSVVADRRGARYWTPERGIETQTALGPLPDGAREIAGADPELHFFAGSWRETPPSDAERATQIVLPRSAFFLALEETLGLTTADLLPEEHVLAAIAATASLGAETKRVAMILVRTAQSFHRADPDVPGLMDAIGVGVLGLSVEAIDQMFLGGDPSNDV